MPRLREPRGRLPRGMRERYKAYADGRKTALENRYTTCIEGTGKKRSHERWLDQQKRRAR
nr:MAG TPA: hypothetical protein [Caudoviricetes sp.]